MCEFYNSKKNQRSIRGVLASVFSPTIAFSGQRQYISEFKASHIYKASSRLDEATQ